MTTTKLLYQYDNLGSAVEIYSDGTKIRTVKGDRFRQPESIDLKITNRCSRNCSFCHEESHSQGKHASLCDILTLVNGLFPGTEIAIGGGNPLEYKDGVYYHLEELLTELSERQLICNLTLHVDDFCKNIYKLIGLQTAKRLYGIGVSITDHAQYYELSNLVRYENKLPIKNVVLHTIAGINSYRDISYYLDEGHNVLILGYKQVGKGKTFYSADVQIKIDELKRYIHSIIEDANGIISFDNLAIEQLGIKEILKETGREHLFMGEDGKFSLYVDATEMQYAISSTHTRMKIPDGMNIIQLYQKVNGWY